MNKSKYYRLAKPKFAMCKRLYNKEFAVLTPTWANGNRTLRHRRCHNVQGLSFYIQYLKLDYMNLKCNFYSSVVKFRNGVPFSRVARYSQERPEGWDEDYRKQIIEADLFIDIDVDNHDDLKHAYKSTIMIIALFDKVELPYTIVFSGMGFHIIVPYRCFQDLGYSLNGKDKNNIYKFYRSIALKLHNTYSELVDLSIYDDRRLRKLPFSVVSYEDGDYVAYEFLTIEEFLNFDIEHYRLSNFNIEKIHNDIKIFNNDGDGKKFLKWLQEQEITPETRKE